MECALALPLWQISRRLKDWRLHESEMESKKKKSNTNSKGSNYRITTLSGYNVLHNYRCKHHETLIWLIAVQQLQPRMGSFEFQQ